MAGRAAIVSEARVQVGSPDEGVEAAAAASEHEAQGQADSH